MDAREPKNGDEPETGGPFTITEVDDEDILPPVINLEEYRKQREYDEFWSDPCWTEPLDPSPNGG